jgi:dihydropteroate synthase
MQENTQYESLLEDIISSLSSSVNKALDRGVESESIVVDPGFGFGKTAEQNLLLLKNLHRICELGKPVLIGPSNKSFIGKVLKAELNERIEGTAATVAIGIANGASIIRVHDVEQMKKVAVMADAVMNIN